MNNAFINFNYYNENNKNLSISLDFLINLEQNCKKCPFFSGVQCHGHGDYYGVCKILYNAKIKDSYDAICDENTKCKLSKYLVIKNDNSITFTFLDEDFKERSNE